MFDIAKARQDGYSEEEITSFLEKNHLDFNVRGALRDGYSLDEVATKLATPRHIIAKTNVPTKPLTSLAERAVQAVQTPKVSPPQTWTDVGKTLLGAVTPDLSLQDAFKPHKKFEETRKGLEATGQMVKQVASSAFGSSMDKNEELGLSSKIARPVKAVGKFAIEAAPFTPTEFGVETAAAFVPQAVFKAAQTVLPDAVTKIFSGLPKRMADKLFPAAKRVAEKRASKGLPSVGEEALARADVIGDSEIRTIGFKTQHEINKIAKKVDDFVDGITKKEEAFIDTARPSVDTQYLKKSVSKQRDIMGVETGRTTKTTVQEELLPDVTPPSYVNLKEIVAKAGNEIAELKEAAGNQNIVLELQSVLKKFQKNKRDFIPTKSAVKIKKRLDQVVNTMYDNVDNKFSGVKEVFEDLANGIRITLAEQYPKMAKALAEEHTLLQIYRAGLSKAARAEPIIPGVTNVLENFKLAEYLNKIGTGVGPYRMTAAAAANQLPKTREGLNETK